MHTCYNKSCPILKFDLGLSDSQVGSHTLASYLGLITPMYLYMDTDFINTHPNLAKIRKIPSDRIEIIISFTDYHCVLRYISNILYLSLFFWQWPNTLRQ